VKIVSIVKHVPDVNATVRTANGEVDSTEVTWVLDGMDEYGVEQAVQLQEQFDDVEVVVLVLGPERAVDAARSALALGADRGVHVLSPDHVDPVVAAHVLASIVRDEAPDLVFVGGKQADWDSAALGPALAEVLDWPLSDWTTSLSAQVGHVDVVHDIDDGTESLRLALPAVITTQQGLNEPRYPSLPNKMRARRKPIETIEFTDLVAKLDRSAMRSVAVSGYASATRARQNRVLDGDTAAVAAELARLLREEGAA